VSRQLSTDASRLPFIAPAALQLHSHSTTMLIKLRLADTINCGAILRHLILDATLVFYRGSDNTILSASRQAKCTPQKSVIICVICG